MNCVQCNKPTDRVCAGCKTLHYCSRECQATDWGKHKRICADLIEGKRGREYGLYLNGEGTYQALYKFLFAMLEEKRPPDAPRSWFTESRNRYWALLNGMAGIYYGYFNDGDDPSGAIENNRVHGFRDLGSFIYLAKRVGAPAEVIDLLNSNNIEPEEYDTAMDALLLFLDEKILANKNTLMLRQVLRRKKVVGATGAPHLATGRY